MTPTRIFRARYSGTCAACGNPINVGDEITWSRRAQKGQRVRHKSCNGVQTSESAPEPTSETPESIQTINAPKDALEVFADAARELSGLKGRVEKLERGENSPKVDAAMIRKLIDESLKQHREPLRIEIKHSDGRTVQLEGVHHVLFPVLLYHSQRREWTYLYGPSQSGKSTAAHNVARTLNLDYGYISLNPQTPDSRLMGFIDAGGTYRPTVFYNLYKNGGVFCIDEVDNASSSLLTTLNSALANGNAAFPCGMVERHSDFVVIATGNTPGRGGTSQYPERRPLDGAFRERFCFLEWGYDYALEEALVMAINADDTVHIMLDWVRAVRLFAKDKGLPIMATPRAAMRLAGYMGGGRT